MDSASILNMGQCGLMALHDGPSAQKDGCERKYAPTSAAFVSFGDDRGGREVSRKYDLPPPHAQRMVKSSTPGTNAGALQRPRVATRTQVRLETTVVLVVLVRLVCTTRLAAISPAPNAHTKEKLFTQSQRT